MLAQAHLWFFTTHRTHLWLILQLTWTGFSYSFWERAYKLAWSLIWIKPGHSNLGHDDLPLCALSSTGSETVQSTPFHSQGLGRLVVLFSGTSELLANPCCRPLHRHICVSLPLTEPTSGLYCNLAEQALAIVSGTECIIWRDHYFEQGLGAHSYHPSWWLAALSTIIKGFWTVLSTQFHSQGLGSACGLIFRHFPMVPHAGTVTLGRYYQRAHPWPINHGKIQNLRFMFRTRYTVTIWPHTYAQLHTHACVITL